MDRDDVEGAVAAAQYFLELYPYAYNTGDLEQWKAMSHPECVFCASVVENVEALHADGGYQTGGDIEWREVTADEGDSEGRFRVTALAREQPSHEVRGASIEGAASGGSSYLVFDVEHTSGWIIHGVGVQAAGPT